jgi:hypothetical protein
MKKVNVSRQTESVSSGGFWEGFRSAFSLFPDTDPRLGTPEDDAENLRGDWELVASDFRKATKRVVIGGQKP